MNNITAGALFILYAMMIVLFVRQCIVNRNQVKQERDILAMKFQLTVLYSVLKVKVKEDEDDSL